jgi:RimJ/RimL family protein N-acetyltransferase
VEGFGEVAEMIRIRPFDKKDWTSLWRIIEPVFRAGETYPCSPDITEEEAWKVWVEAPLATYVAVNEETDVLGTYYIKPNQPALGGHVCNCGYIVSENARRRGIATLMCRDSQQRALSEGFLAMQYNLVVSTNEVALRLWKRNGFHVVGMLPKAFRHRRFGFVDALVMYKLLEP